MYAYFYCSKYFGGFQSRFAFFQSGATGYSSILWIVYTLFVGIPPPTGWLKVNVDGALIKSNAGGVGIIIRDSMGKLIVAAGWSICHWDSTQVERMAIHYIDKLVVEWMYDLNGIIVEGDNSNVIEYMQKFKFKELWKQRIDDWEECSWIKLFQ
ncbi:hypothetical protein MA16_Dca016876 [Dendrobium catenatum]|uniref:RNase H type-1 domain-containing protein n=1 Tax=Dendrobium catenatum TaxID=906689 RepID=A0A2I0WNR7_9ASPA|nr:hypothetical protein MA16_Dca016876 [Dendrobium catenatum]